MQENGRGASGTRAACIDAETLAAWADGGLSQSDAAAVETHLADCDRCTAMIATFVRTAPEPPATVTESLWTLRLRQGYGETSPKRSARKRGWHLRWLVPAATAATVAALYVLVPRPASQITVSGPAPTTESQAVSSGAPAVAATTPSALADATEQETPAQPAQATPTEALATRAPAPETRQESTDERRADASDTSAKRLQAAPLNETIAAPPPPAREADRAEARSADAQSERFSPPVPQAAPVAPPAPAEVARPAAAPPATSAGATFSAAPAARARAVGGVAGNAASVIEVVSPDPMTRWRVIGTGQVERSTNGGARWERATLPESATVTGGSSPSPTVCWLVGRTGSIYVTTDGLRFVRVPFPDRADFVSIQATDSRRATVVTIDGRTMRTDDQGVTWVRMAP